MSLTTCPLPFDYCQIYQSPIPSQFASSREELNKYNAGWVIEPNAISMPPNFLQALRFCGERKEPCPRAINQIPNTG